MRSVSVIIPTYNAGKLLPQLLNKLASQTLLHELVIIDSNSTDDTENVLKTFNIEAVKIKKENFSHGGTRNLGLSLVKSDVVVYMTQDALPESNDTLELLVNSLYYRDDIVMSYGRQIPFYNAKAFARIARVNNYPDYSLIKDKSLIPELGIKTCSCSNSFAAYFRKELLDINGFPENLILGEDVAVAAQFILQNKAVAYSSEAKVYHSHDYTLTEEFKRYFDIGVFHHDQRVLLSNFPPAESEGFKYVINEWKELIHMKKYILIPAQIVRSIAKYSGYKLGLNENLLPNKFKRLLSMHNYFWKQ